jgi:hypothetical protein
LQDIRIPGSKLKIAISIKENGVVSKSIMHPLLPHPKEDQFSKKKKKCTNLIQIVDQIYFLPNLLVASVSLANIVLLYQKDGSSPTVLQWQNCWCLVFLKHKQTSRAYPLCLTPSLLMHLHHTIESFLSFQYLCSVHARSRPFC